MVTHQAEKFKISYTFERAPWILKDEGLARQANIIVHALAGMTRRDKPLTISQILATTSTHFKGVHVATEPKSDRTSPKDVTRLQVLFNGRIAMILTARLVQSAELVQ